MAEYINQPELCKRLIDYVVVVGVRNPTLGLTETPETLRKFPTEDYNDFYFPPDVVFFCQPEGSCTVTKKISLRQATTFVFTLTDKESGKTRYGVCMNLFRPCYASITKEFKDPKSQTKDDNDAASSRSKGQTRCMSLTSVCIISHHPIFSSFRECLFVLRRMIESRGGHYDRSSSSSQTSQASDCWSLFLCNEDPKLSPLQEDMREIESWIHRLLVTPVPIPGRTEVELELLPQELHPAICFAFPDAKRFSLVDFPIHLPLELLGVETFLKVLTCILLEQKVVFQSRDYNALTMTILAMSSLLYPLEYMFPVIPLLPSCMNNAEQLLLAPTPYIIGVPASFFKYKNNDFNNPHDLWIVDLDSNKITVPFQADELPSLPEPETSILKGNLKRALASLSVPPQTIPNLDGQFSASNGTSDSFSKVPLGLTSNHIVYGNDVDAVDVAVRVAMTSFFLAQNVLGGLQEHTRTLRLFPRPVVAVQKDAFLQSLPTVSKFVMALVETQNVEYFAEWLVYPTNIVYTRIQMGITDPHLVGDKPRWYNYKLDKLNFKAFDPDSKLCNQEWCEYETELFNDIYESDDSERLRRSSVEDDDSSSCYSSVSDTVAEMFRGDIHGETPSGSVKPPFTPPDAASPTPNCAANLQNAANFWNHEDRVKRQYSLEEDEDFVDDVSYSVSNPPSPVLDHRRESSNSGSSVVSDPVAKSDMTGQTNSDVNGIHKLDRHSSADFTNSSVSTSSSTPSRSRTMDAKLASLQANALFKPFSKEGNPISREDQQFLHDVVASVLNANGVGIFKKKRLRDLMMKETCRQNVANKFLLEISDDKKSEVVSDVRVNKSVLRGMLEIIRSVVFGLETSVSNFGLGQVTSAYHFLRIAHTHYYGREIKDVVTESDDGARISPTESISNLSDTSDTTVSANESGDRSTLVNSDCEQDSGHCDANEVYGTDIDSVMVPMFQRKFEEKTYRHLNLVRCNSDVTDVNTIATSGQKTALTRTLSNVETHQEVATKNSGLWPGGNSKPGSRTPAGSPRLAHMKMTSPSSSMNAVACLPNVDFLARKSDLSEGFRFCNGELFDVSEGVKPTTNTGRKYLFQGLLAERSSLWDHMEFWEYLFMDVVSAEREALGMDQNHGEMIERYRSLGGLEQKRLEEDEDKVLGTTLFNITAFMISLNVEGTEMKKKVRRMIGKAHIGMSQSQRIGQLLAKLDYVRGNDVDLRPDCSCLMTKKTFVVHCGSDIIGDVYFMEVYDDCILLRAPSGAILERWWYEKLVNITYSPKTKMLCLWYRQGQDTQLNKFCTKKCKALYFCIKATMQKAAERLQGLKSGPQLGGKFPAQDVEDGQVGILEVSLDGITVKFKNKKTHLHLNCIKNCSTQKGILVIDEFDPVTQEEIQHRFKSSSASDICYAVLCLFSYAAASKGLQVRS